MQKISAKWLRELVSIHTIGIRKSDWSVVAQGPSGTVAMQSHDTRIQFRSTEAAFGFIFGFGVMFGRSFVFDHETDEHIVYTEESRLADAAGQRRSTPANRNLSRVGM